MDSERENGDARQASDRAAYLRFVRANHPDAGGDPDVFIEGMRRFAHPDESDGDRYDAPIVFVSHPRGLRGLVRLVLRRRRRPPRVR